MSTSFLYQQQNNTQTDTIKQQDSIGGKRSLQNTYKQNVLSVKSQKSALVKNIEDGIDATSYIYYFSGQETPLNNLFLNKFYFPKTNRTISTTKQENMHNDAKNFIKFSESDYLLFVLIILVTIIGFVKINGKSYLKRTISSIRSFTYSYMLLNEHNKLFQLNDLLLQFVFHISFGILLVSLTHYLGIAIPFENKVLIYLSFIGINYVLIIAYKQFLRIFGILVSHKKAVYEYLFYTNSILIFLGILNVIFLFGILFSPEKSTNLLIYILLLIYIIAYITRSFKIISIFLANRFSIFYMILYFCALEIIPILIFGKLILNVYNNYIGLEQLFF